jgi:hypothetical protein
MDGQTPDDRWSMITASAPRIQGTNDSEAASFRGNMKGPSLSQLSHPIVFATSSVNVVGQLQLHAAFNALGNHESKQETHKLGE